jgi:hypothetical protein
MMLEMIIHYKQGAIALIAIHLGLFVNDVTSIPFHHPENYLAAFPRDSLGNGKTFPPHNIL